MMKMQKPGRIVALLLSLLMTGMVLAGCSGNGAGGTTSIDPEEPVSTDPITFDLLMASWPLWDEPMTADPLGQWLIEQTNVTINVELITGDIVEKCALLLATQDYPDLMVWPGDSIAGQFIEQNVFVPLDEHFDDIPNVVSRFGSDIGALYDVNTQHMYRIPQWSTGNVIQIDTGISVRHDIMKEYFGDRATEESVITLEELENFYLEYKKDHPKNASGTNVYPFTAMAPADLVYKMCQVYGIPGYYETGKDTVGLYLVHEKMPDLLATLNRWYNKGILDPEFAINKLENVTNKLATHSAISTMVQESGLVEANNSLQNQDPESYMFSYYKVAETPGEEAYVTYSTVGSGGLCLTSSCEDPRRALAWMNFMNDPEVMFYLCNGLPGTFWDYDEAGKVAPKLDAVSEIADLWQRFRKVGGYKYQWMLNEGPDSRFEAYDGSFYQIIHGEGGEAYIPSNKGRKTFWTAEKDTLINPALFQGIEPDSNSDEGIMMSEVYSYWESAVPKIIMAKNEAEARKMYDDVKKQMLDAGLEECMEKVAPRYFAKKEIMAKD